MANYRLCFKENEEIREIDLSFIMNSKKLIDLDRFTSDFENQEQLLNEIATNGLVFQNKKNIKLMVVYTHNKEEKTIPVMYRSASKYIFGENRVSMDAESVRHKLHSLCKDFEFLKKLAEYYNHHTVLGNCIDNIISSTDYEFYSKDLYKLVQELFMDKVYPKNNFYYGGLRNIALFIDRYEQTKKYNEAKRVIEEESSTYDMNTLLTDDGDPFFPPNSEEEARYKRQLEEQDDKYSIESHPHYRR